MFLLLAAGFYVLQSAEGTVMRTDWRPKKSRKHKPMNDGTRFYLLMLSNQMTACFTKTGLINCSTCQIFPVDTPATKWENSCFRFRLVLFLNQTEGMMTLRRPGYSLVWGQLKKNHAPQGTYGLYSCKKGKLIIDLLNLFVVDCDEKNFSLHLLWDLAFRFSVRKGNCPN